MRLPHRGPNVKDKLVSEMSLCCETLDNRRHRNTPGIRDGTTQLNLAPSSNTATFGCGGTRIVLHSDFDNSTRESNIASDFSSAT